MAASCPPFTYILLLFFPAIYPTLPSAITGEYPDLPPQEAGGSKVILKPPLPTVEELIAANAAAAAAAGGKGAKGGAKGGSRPASAAAGTGKKPGAKDGKNGKFWLHRRHQETRSWGKGDRFPPRMT